ASNRSFGACSSTRTTSCRARYKLLSSNASCVPRNLSSFPPRRSSDLLQLGGRLAAGAVRRHRLPGRHVARADLEPQLHALRLPRSEEHTSELQSRGQLVCRLLLEKKTSGAWWSRAQAA